MLCKYNVFFTAPYFVEEILAEKDKLQEAFDIYVVAPTQQNLEDMTAAAIAYRESWIETRAVGVREAT